MEENRTVREATERLLEIIDDIEIVARLIDRNATNDDAAVFYLCRQLDIHVKESKYLALRVNHVVKRETPKELEDL